MLKLMRSILLERLHHAVREQNLQLIELLIAQGADPNGFIDGQCPLTMLVSLHGERRPHLPTVYALLMLGANVNVQDGTGATPLAYAAENGYDDICRLLSAAGADPLIIDKHGRIPLMRAAQGGHLMALVTLLYCREPKVQLLTKDHWGHSVRAYASNDDIRGFLSQFYTRDSSPIKSMT
jgi:ankyrin repeat protein